MTDTILHFLALGFSHILPEGPDHVLFVLGLFLICRDVTVLLWQITLFTLAHSLTMALAMCGLVAVPAGPVEVLIALSIAAIALENIFHPRTSGWRPFIILVFGLVHGLGFASSFADTVIAPGELAISLVFLTLGVELGQLVVVGWALVLFGAFWGHPWYRRAVTIPGSLVIAGMGLIWVGERLAA